MAQGCRGQSKEDEKDIGGGLMTMASKCLGGYFCGAKSIHFDHYLVEKLQGISARLGHNTENIKRENIGGALPDRVDQHIAHGTAKASLFHVALSSKGLHGFLGHGKGVLGAPDLQDRSQETEKGDVAVLDLGEVVVEGLDTSQHGHTKERELARGAVLELHVGKSSQVQRLVLEQVAKDLTTASILLCTQDKPLHGSRASHATVHTGNVQDRRNVLDTSVVGADLLGHHAVQFELGGGQGLGTDLVLQAVDPHAVELALLVADIGQIQGQAFASVVHGASIGGVMGSGQEHGYICIRGAGEPFEARDGPRLEAGVPDCLGLGASNVTSSRALGHPLATGDEYLRVATGS